MGWRRFRASEPGHRFQDRYRRRQENEHGWRDPRKLFYVVGGLIVAVGSLLFGVLPGPGTLTFFLGVGMIAGEFRRRPVGLGRGEGEGARALGRGDLEVVRCREDPGRLGGRSPLRDLPPPLRQLTSGPPTRAKPNCPTSGRGNPEDQRTSAS